MTRRITAETTDEQILSGIVSAKQELLEFVTAEIDSEYLKGDRMVGLAQNVYSQEAVATVAMTYRNMLQNGADVQKRTQYLLSVLTRGADDTWSGRQNDSKRSAFDAVRSFVDAQFDEIRYGSDN